MKKTTALTLSIFFIILSIPSLAGAENISFKFSLATSPMSHSDLNTWIDSANALWQDWNNYVGGSLTGLLEAPGYGLNWEAEVRIPVISGLTLNLAFGQVKGTGEGTVTFRSSGGEQSESQFIRSDVSATPIKIGLSYVFDLPFLPRLHLFICAGRHLVFMKYNAVENFEATFTLYGKELEQWFKKDSSFRSEAAGFYATVGAEFDLIKQIAVVLEIDKSWNSVEGFKGPYTYKDHTFVNGKPFKEEGKVSLYFYQRKNKILNTYSSILSGHTEKPGGDDIKDIRPGEFLFNRFCLKLGIRFKF